LGQKEEAVLDFVDLKEVGCEVEERLDLGLEVERKVVEDFQVEEVGHKAVVVAGRKVVEEVVHMMEEERFGILVEEVDLGLVVLDLVDLVDHKAVEDFLVGVVDHKAVVEEVGRKVVEEVVRKVAEEAVVEEVVHKMEERFGVRVEEVDLDLVVLDLVDLGLVVVWHSIVCSSTASHCDRIHSKLSSSF
jgi:hypothetical protein